MVGRNWFHKLNVSYSGLLASLCMVQVFVFPPSQLTCLIRTTVIILLASKLENRYTTGTYYSIFSLKDLLYVEIAGVTFFSDLCSSVDNKLCLLSL